MRLSRPAAPRMAQAPRSASVSGGAHRRHLGGLHHLAQRAVAARMTMVRYFSASGKAS